MDVLKLAELLLPPDEKREMHVSLELLAQGDDAAFYEKNRSIVRNILFLETLEEFLDFSRENRLDDECFCATFLCAKGYGVQVGGYEDDLTPALTEFFRAGDILRPEISEVISREKIYTDCDDGDNFKSALTEINQRLEACGVRLMVLEDFVYCGCEYTLLLMKEALAREAASSWDSGQFALFL